MLEKIREGSQGVWAVVILGLVVLSFVFAGVGGYVSSSPDVAAATVNGDDITQQELERAYQIERARMESQLGEAFSAAMADSEYLAQFRQGVLDRLIGNKLVEQTARELGLRVSDNQVREAILSMPEFQVGGQFNNDQFQNSLRRNGYQTHTFRDLIRVEMTRQQVASALLGSEFTIKSEVKEIYELQQQRRDVRFLSVPVAPFAAEVTLSEEQVNQYYQANLSSYDTQEQVKVAYVELKVSDLMDDVSVSEEEVLASYETNQSRYRSDERRRVSHILVEIGEDKDASKAQAEALLARVKGGEDFAELAKTESADLFSAENGGDLDFLVRGDFEGAFEDAVFALAEVGSVTEVVETDSGFHIVKLTELQAEDTTPFEQVRAGIEEQLKLEKATEEFYGLQTRMAEVAFEVPDSLEDVAAEINGQIIETVLFDRNNAPQPIAAPVALNAAFSSEMIEEALNSDVIEVSDEHVLVLRVTEHQPERTMALEEVREQIEANLTTESAQLAARTWMEALLVSIDGGEDVSAKLAEKTLEWQEQSGVTRFGSPLDGAITEEAFKLAASGNNKAVVDMYNGDVALVEVTNIQPGETADEQVLSSLGRRIEASKGQTAFNDIIEAMKEKADISIYL